MRASSPTPAARPSSLAAALALLACTLLFACSLMVPSDDYFIRDAQLPPAEGDRSQGGQGGASVELAGAGGIAGGGEGGASGVAGSEAGAGSGGDEQGGVGGAGGEPAERCRADFLEHAGSCVSISGCSDGTREAFLPMSAWPNLAGCTATWPRASLRAAKTGAPCGFQLGQCAAPADACGDGWHVCASPPYAPTEISEQATADECAAQPGAYVAAVGDQACEPCSEAGHGAACCGNGCVQQNGSCIYPGQTAWFGVYNGYKNVCGAIESDLAQRGVLCCRD